MFIERRWQLNVGTNKTDLRRRFFDNVTDPVAITYERDSSAFLTGWEFEPAHGLKVSKI